MKYLAALLLLALALPSAALDAQTVPFGKNKIQYRNFEWHVLSGEHVDVYYYPEEEKLARLTLSYAEESYAFLERKFRHHPFRRVPLIVYSSDQHFEQTNVLPGFIPEGVLGFTEYLKRRVALPFRGDYDQFRNTLRHELVHYFQLSKLAEVQSLHPRHRRQSPQFVHWWTEGLAEFWSSTQTAEDDMFIRDMVLNGRVPSIRQFTYLYSFASYPLGAELHKYLSERFGDQYIVDVYENYWKYDSFERTLEGVLGVKLDRLSREWQYHLQQRFFPVYADRAPLEIGAEPLIYEGGSNFKPVVYRSHPDSLPVLFFLSPRSGYTNIYATRLDRGERGVRVLIEGERSAEFESFHAYESSIDVSEGGVIAFVSKYLERDALFLWDLERREIVGRYQWPDLVGLKSPSWAPGGTRVVFEGLSTAGFSDLYILDFETQQRTALTADHFRDEDPDWSPDGRTIVFASDRTPYGDEGFTNLFLYDLEEQRLSYLTHGRWHDQDPRWDPAGARVAFSSDRGGTYDLYEVDAAGNGRRLTTMTGGAFDPEWLPDGEGLVFAGFSEGMFRIYRYTGSDSVAADARIALDVPPDAAQQALVLGDSTGYAWNWVGTDAPAVDSARIEPYETLRKLSLDFAGGDAIVAPGVGAAQGVQLLATDMLGNHILFAGISAAQATDVSAFVDNFSGQLMYLNLAHRLNYGAGLFRFKGRFRDVTFDIYDEHTYGGFFLASYPFSKFNRLELQLAVERSDREDVADLWDFGGIGPNPAADSVDLTRTGLLTSNFLSYVKDNTLWLSTGPIDGTRYNLSAGLVTCFACTLPSELTGQEVTRGATAEHWVLTGDFRHYFRTTLLSAYAVRLYGFYSDGAIPGRTVLGGPHRLRGYPRFSLAGSRVLLANQEWRFPILHGLALAFPFGTLRFPGIQGALFTDLGSSWLKEQEPTGAWGSYGLGLRTSLGPPLVLRLDMGRRFAIGDEPLVQFFDGERFGDTFVDFFFGFNY